MENDIIETSYPITFRKENAASLGAYLKNRQSAVLIGMKRVGISNFLRFFLNHKDIAKTYIGDGNPHLFIPVDLNDLVEREIGPFWILTLKRILDVVNKHSFGKEVKKKIETLFLDSIQSQDLFLTIDSVRRSLIGIVESGILPTLFFLRFDRMKDAITPELFSNLEGLRDATHHKLAYIFTSVRGLDDISPSVFTRASISVFSKDLYVKPAKEEDAKIIFKTYKNRYGLNFSGAEDQILLDIVDGYVQYLQLSLIYLHENKSLLKTKHELFDALSKDEEIRFLSEELWESLTQPEQNATIKLIQKENLSKDDKDAAKYLWDTGLADDSKVFSPLFEYYVKQIEKKTSNSLSGAVEFTKKENLLFNYLFENISLVCEREQIVEKVWPEVEALGVSDWAIDRLIARVRSKLKLQKSEFEIQTIKTRGYKLVEAHERTRE